MKATEGSIAVHVKIKRFCVMTFFEDGRMENFTRDLNPLAALREMSKAGSNGYKSILLLRDFSLHQFERRFDTDMRTNVLAYDLIKSSAIISDSFYI